MAQGSQHTNSFWRLVAGRSNYGRARGLLRAWRFWERFASWWWPAPALPGHPNGIFRLRFTTYRGEPVELPDGTRILQGDLVGEFHLNSEAIVASVTESRWNVLPPLREELRSLARWTECPDFPAGVKAFYGVTILGRGALRLGFVLRPLPVTLYRRFERLYLSGLLLLYSGEGQQRYNRGETRTVYPEAAWLSRAELLRRYGGESSGGAHRGSAHQS
jgi:hypothetical protein